MTPTDQRTYRIDLGYEGTDFTGSQRQPGARTVQGVIEAALEQLTQEPVAMALAGRTDRGVHAVGQVGSTRLRWARGAVALQRGLGALTPDDVVVHRATVAPDEFHARYSARSREYRYRVWQAPEPPVLLRRQVWHVRAGLDLDAMADAARVLIGTHDFSSVAGAGVGVPESDVSCIRSVTEVEWSRLAQPFEPNPAGELFEFRIVADGFLPHMVRNIVGDLVAVGRGVRSAEWFGELLRARDRRQGLAPAPPHGLVLWHVNYRDEERTGAMTYRGVEGQAGVERDENVLTEGV